MPRLMGQDDANMQQNTIGGSGFGFTGTRIDHLSATSYTLASVIIDASGSVSPFALQLDEMLRTVIRGCKLSPRSDNILVRALSFNTSYRPNGINEIHGFKPIATSTRVSGITRTRLGCLIPDTSGNAPG